MDAKTAVIVVLALGAVYVGLTLASRIPMPI